jgi:hypothetical protein
MPAGVPAGPLERTALAKRAIPELGKTATLKPKLRPFYPAHPYILGNFAVRSPRKKPLCWKFFLEFWLSVP